MFITWVLPGFILIEFWLKVGGLVPELLLELLLLLFVPEELMLTVMFPQLLGSVAEQILMVAESPVLPLAVTFRLAPFRLI